jgi:hypothetical protein
VGVNNEDFFDFLISKGEAFGDFEQMLLRSFYVNVTMHIESLLKLSCEFISDYKKSLFSVFEIKGNGLERYRKYIEKLTGKNFPQNEHSKLKLDTLRIIRNAIVHSDGILQKSDESTLCRYLGFFPDEFVIDGGRIILHWEGAKKLIGLHADVTRELFEIR